ncbi:hypothetical protein, partial [Thiolapillus sp.]
PWNFSRRKEKMRFPLCSHFQSLVVIENGGTSLSHLGFPLFRDALLRRSHASSRENSVNTTFINLLSVFSGNARDKDKLCQMAQLMLLRGVESGQLPDRKVVL